MTAQSFESLRSVPERRHAPLHALELGKLVAIAACVYTALRFLVDWAIGGAA